MTVLDEATRVGADFVMVQDRDPALGLRVAGPLTPRRALFLQPLASKRLWTGWTVPGGTAVLWRTNARSACFPLVARGSSA